MPAFGSPYKGIVTPRSSVTIKVNTGADVIPGVNNGQKELGYIDITYGMNVPQTYFVYLVDGIGDDDNALFEIEQAHDNDPPVLWAKDYLTAGATHSVRIAVEDQDGWVNEHFFTMEVADAVAPAVTVFTATGAESSYTATVTGLTATGSATHFMITEEDVAPPSDSQNWVADPGPLTYDIINQTGTGVYTLYAWAKDADDNVSTSASAEVTLTDTTAPVMTGFAITDATGTSYVVAITSATTAATDFFGATDFKITETNVAPAAGDPGWVADPGPTEYTIVTQSGTGTYTLYCWAKDAAGNVSTAAASDTIDLTIA